MTITTSDWINIVCTVVGPLITYALGFLHARKRPDDLAKWVKAGPSRDRPPLPKAPKPAAPRSSYVPSPMTPLPPPRRRLDRDR